MNPKYITLKLFAIIAVFLTFFIGLILLFQTKYFGAYYSNVKENTFHEAMNHAKTSFDNINASTGVLLSELKVLYDEYGCDALLYPMDNNKNLYNEKILNLDSIHLKESSNITNLLYKFIIQTINESKTIEQISKTIESSDTGLKYMIATQIVKINGKDHVLAMAASLQSVDEVMNILNNISWLAYVVAILFSLVLAAIIAKLIAKPLIKEIERKNLLDNMRKDFIANASHEMKTPISIISGYAESLIDGILLPDERIEYEQIIYDEAQKMQKLVRDMLEIAILQNDKNELHKSEVQLDKLIQKTLSRLARQIKEKKLIVEVGSLEAITALVDESMLETVFVNFINNAISHTEEERSMRIRLTYKSKAIRFEIENDGLPILDDAIAHLWESFYRVDKSHNREAGRFGLGLFAVKTIIEKHNGIVGVLNTQNGVMFYFEIPEDQITNT
jgi:signal transduction histidine kinase